MTKRITIYFYFYLLPILTFGQITKVEEYISVDSGKYFLNNVIYKDISNRIIEKRQIDYNGKNSNDWTTLTKFEYVDSLPVRIEIKSKDNPNELVVANNFYNSNNNQTKSILKRNNDTVLLSTFIYNNRKQLIEMNTISFMNYLGEKSKQVKTKKQYQYSDTILTEEWILTADNKKTEHYKFENKAESRKIIKEKLLIDKLDYLEKQKFIEVYNDSNQLIEDYTYFNNGTLFRKHQYSYNKKNQLLEILEFGSDIDKPMVRIEYKYYQIEKID